MHARTRAIYNIILQCDATRPSASIDACCWQIGRSIGPSTLEAKARTHIEPAADALGEEVVEAGGLDQADDEPEDGQPHLLRCGYVDGVPL